jgi:O-acetyl-ADP-ribose deacetylase (regulator of RNase III)
MGSGIAVEFRNRFPEMYVKYKQMCEQAFLKPGMAYPWLDFTHRGDDSGGEPTWIYNIASQFYTGADAHYDCLEAGLLYVRFHMRKHGAKHLALPRIGAGIGGLTYEGILYIIEEVFDAEPDIHVTVVSLEDA